MQTPTERVDRTLEEILTSDGEDFLPLISNLNDEERQLFSQLVTALRSGEQGDLDILDDFWKVDYTRRPPTMEEFITDEYWLGSRTRPTDDNEGIFPGWREILLHDFDLDSQVHNTVVTGSLGIGKCHRAGDRVLMYDGTTKEVENVKIGDRLMGDDSRPRRVLSLSRGRGRLHKVQPLFPKHSVPMHVNDDHILCLQNTYSGEVVDISIRDYLTSDSRFQRDHKLYRVPVQYSSQSVDIDPYWLGLWLGDRAWRECSIASMDAVINDYHVNYLTSFNLDVVDRRESIPGKTRCYAGVVKRGERNPLLDKLRSYGLATSKESGEKFIPHVYLANSRDIRLNLLAGLIDTDGHHVKGSQGCYAITTKHEKLANGILQLVASLGYAVGIKYGPKKIKSTGFVGHYWHIQISAAHDIPCRLPRKKSQARSIHKTGTRSGFTITDVGEDDWFGFNLDGNHRYLMADGLVTHNSWVCCVIILYRITLARLLRNPSHFFGMSRGSEIYYSILSITRAAVRETVFGDAMEFMAQSPYFREECGFNPDKKYTDNLIDLGNNITVNAGSKGWHVIGKNMMGILLDEGNFRLEKNPNLKAYSLYNNVRARIQNRFQKFRGFLPAISLLASSAADESSFTEKVKKEILEASQPKRQTIYQFAVYRIKSHTLRLSDKYFKVSYGLKSEDPKVLKGWYDKNGIPMEGEIPEVPSSGASTELVPEDYYDGFRRSTKQYLMDISGISVGGSHRLLSSTVDLEQCIDIATADGLRNPCKLKTISLSMDDKSEMYQYLDQAVFLTRRLSRVIPARHPESLRFAHVDLATQTMAGVSVGHLVGRQRVETYRAGEVFEEYRLVFEYDFILTITAGEASPISLGKIQNFFFWLRDHAGFRFGLITADQWQSEMPLQTLQAAGFNVDKLSMDRTKTPYYEWRSAIQEKRLRLFRQDQLVHEASELLDLADKVDHPPEDEGGSKDTSDSAAGAYYNAISYTSKTGSNVALDASIPALVPDTLDEMEVPPVSIQLPASIRVRPNSVFEA